MPRRRAASMIYSSSGLEAPAAKEGPAAASSSGIDHVLAFDQFSGHIRESRLDRHTVWSRGDTIRIRWSRDGHTKTWSREGLRRG